MNIKEIISEKFKETKQKILSLKTLSNEDAVKNELSLLKNIKELKNYISEIKITIKNEKDADNYLKECNKRLIYIENEYKKAIDSKYQFNQEINKEKYNSNYIEKYKENTLKEITDSYKEKLYDQDNDIVKLSSIVTIGNKQARDINHMLVVQNNKLDNLNSDTSESLGFMIKTRIKFENYLVNESYCKLYIIVIFLLAILVFQLI